MKIELKGRISADNASQLEQLIACKTAESPLEEIVFDAAELEYISSAGLRILLRTRKTKPHMRIENASPDVYTVLETTGFTEMMPVTKAYRSISVEGCELIDCNASGSIYHIDSDNVIKVYNGGEALSRIQLERDRAKLAAILGIPTSISCEVVKVGDSYGAIFGIVNTRSFSTILNSEPKKTDWCAVKAAKVLNKLHGTLVPEGELPDIRMKALSWGKTLQATLPGEAGRKLLALLQAIPYDSHMIHGDYHPRNLALQNDDVLLINMDSLAIGNPIFELALMYDALIGQYELNHEKSLALQGFDFETACSFWHKTLAAYLGTNCAHKLAEVENKARLVGYTRLIQQAIGQGESACGEAEKEIEVWKQELLELLERADTLLFRTDELEIEALRENLEEVQEFVDERLKACDCSPKTQMQISVSVEEIFINIANYAYEPNIGKAKIRAVVTGDPASLTLTFRDWGTPYDPLAREDPDVTLPAEDRNIGGLGIYMTKTFMDEESYTYRDGQNILTLKKIL